MAEQASDVIKRLSRVKRGYVGHDREANGQRRKMTEAKPDMLLKVSATKS